MHGQDMSSALLRLRGSSRQILLPAISVALVLLVLAVPDLAPPANEPDALAAYHARVVALIDPAESRGDGASGGFGADATVLMFEGPDAGKEIGAYLQGPGGQQDGTGYRVGEEVVVTYTATSEGTTFVAVSDRWRLPQLGVLAIVFAAAVVATGGWRGMRALLALALTTAVVIRILIPLLVQGVPPIPVAVVLATIVTILAVGLTEGFSRASVAAILGTAGALAFTALLAAVTIAVTSFSNAVGSELIYLETASGVGLDLRGLLLAAFIFGAIGVLDDVTVTQATAVEELVLHGRLQGRRLFASAFNVGRIAYRRDGQHALPRVSRRQPAADRPLCRQPPAAKPDRQRRASRDRDRPDAGRQPRHRGGRPVHDPDRRLVDGGWIRGLEIRIARRDPRAAAPPRCRPRRRARRHRDRYHGRRHRHGAADRLAAPIGGRPGPVRRNSAASRTHGLGGAAVRTTRRRGARRRVSADHPARCRLPRRRWDRCARDGHRPSTPNRGPGGCYPAPRRGPLSGGAAVPRTAGRLGGNAP